MTGSCGFDVLQFSRLSGSADGTVDLIADFHAAEDLINLTRIDANANAAGRQAGDFVGEGPLGLGKLGFSAGLLPGGVNEDVADLGIRITGVLELPAGDFLP